MGAVRDFSDLSMYQGNVDWDTYYIANDLAYVKVTQGERWVDPFFRTPERVKAIRRANGIFGGYHFADSMDPEAEANHHVDTLLAAGGLREGDLASVLDVERGNFGPQGNRKWVRRWKRQYRRRLRKLGYSWRTSRPALYTGSFWRYNVYGGPLGMRWWWAAYVSDPKPYIPAAFLRATKIWFAWQFTDRGNTSGVRSSHDRNHFKGTTYKLGRMRLRKL